MSKPMLLTLSVEIPKGDEWLYETKYDGFRCMLEWEREPILISRNGNKLNQNFPEIIDFCFKIEKMIKPFLPLFLDGELVYLVNNFQSDFSVIQTRGRMRDARTINKSAKKFPCHLVVFDILEYEGIDQKNLIYTKRKEIVQNLFKSVHLPTSVDYENINRLQLIDVYHNSSILWNKIMLHNGEGLIAKRKVSKWISNSRSTSWLKIKNWRYVTVILTTYDKKNGYFSGAVYQENNLIEVVSFLHGLKEDERKTLVTLFERNGKSRGENVWKLEPSISIEIACIDFLGEQLREPRFHAFRLDIDSKKCTWKNMLHQLNPIPKSVQVTHPEKPVFPLIGFVKEDYLFYLQNIASYMLPFLYNRPLTLIRYPHGVPGEHFYQKNSSENSPEFVHQLNNNANSMICNNIETLLWLGNQLAIEFHIPFQTIQTDQPTEIVFDLDPPSVDQFFLAVEAAIRIKAILDQFQLKSFIKTSGGKGMQIYIPISINSFSYQETGLFTKFICDFLVEQNPEWFTIERLKKNRHNKLYLDYVQHREGKTIIAPFSTRGNEKGLIATPLYWDEVNDSLKPDKFTIPAVLNRIENEGNPFRSFKYEAGDNVIKLTEVLNQLKGE